MSVHSKHVATFLLGAAAALASYKYMNMTPAEKEKLSADLKDKAGKIKAEAESAMDKGKEYFEELKTKGGDALKEHFGDISGVLHNLFGGGGPTGTDANTGATDTKV
ncbi:MAG: YtxH domain-containing protein [Bacteroidota bacterium]